MDPLHLLTHTSAFVLGVVLFIVVTVSLLRTVVTPRPLRSNYSDAITGIVIGGTRLIARLRRSYAYKDSVLAWGGPLLIIGMLVGWLIGYFVAYSLLIFGASSTDRAFSEAARQAGSALFTLGMSGARTDDLVVIEFLAAATGPIVIAMLIGFLPSVYSSYLERERTMASLALIAGDPMWAPEWIVRSQLTGALGDFNAQMVTWAEWATNLRLTHTTYPVLQHVRSPRLTRHYVVTLLGLLDTAALLASLSTKVEHRHLFTMLLNGSQAFDSLYLLFYAPRKIRSRIPVLGRLISGSARDDYTTFAVPAWEQQLAAVHDASARDTAHSMGSIRIGDLVAGESQPIALTREEFEHAVAMIRESGFEIDRHPDEAWAMFRMIRSRYEFPAYVMAERLTAVPAPWSGPRRGFSTTIAPTSALEMLAQRGRSSPPQQR